MEIQIQARDLVRADFTAREIQAILSASSGEDQVRLMLRGRGRLLDKIHEKQQALDQLDYFVHMLRQNEGKK